jgi:hypothetical protein
MNNEAQRLRHERNVWRAIAIGLAATLVVLMTIGGGAALLTVIRNRREAVRAEIAMVEAAQERLQAEQVMEAHPELPRLFGKQDEPITKQQAIEIAEEHLKVEGRHNSDAILRENGDWRVTIRRVPARPGGFTAVIVDHRGNVVRVEAE